LLCNIFFGSNFVFLPLHSIGLYAFPRRITDYSVGYVCYTVFVTVGLCFICLFCCVVVLFFVCEDATKNAATMYTGC